LNKVVALPLNAHYAPEIRGYGELYEQVSVNRLLKRLRKKHRDGLLLLAPSNSNSRIRQLVPPTFKIVETGYVDSPPWKSNPRTNPRKIRFQRLATLAFKLLAFFEPADRGHMIYVFAVTTRMWATGPPADLGRRFPH
jgi:hypothetical protein